MWSADLESLRAQVRSFVDEHVVPVERAILDEDARRERSTLRAIQAKAKAQGLWTPHLPVAFGGRGLGVMGMSALFREMGRSPVGAAAFTATRPIKATWISC